MNIILGEEKDMSRKKSQKLKLLRLLTAQLIAICLLIMVLTQAIFKSPPACSGLLFNYNALYNWSELLFH